MHFECARGIASFIVIFHHFLLAFWPAAKLPFLEGGLKYTPLYFLINGTGAVTFFFLLSGFVLALGFYRNPSLEALFTSIVKRLPRLIVPVGASTLLGFAVLAFAGNQYGAAAAYSGSDWLEQYGSAPFPEDFVPSLWDAAVQSFLVFLVPNHEYYNTNLWTMTMEFYGSLVVFAISFVFWFKSLRSLVVMAIVHFGVAMVFAEFRCDIVPFIVGSFLAYCMAARKTALHVSARWTCVLLAVGAVGYAAGWWISNTVSSLSIMLVLLGNRSVAEHLSGRIGTLLGTLSFPLYLVHTLVITSVSSFCFARLSMAGVSAPVILSLTLLVTLAVSFVVCLPFVLIDAYWVRWLNAQVKSLVRHLAQMFRSPAPGISMGWK